MPFSFAQNRTGVNTKTAEATLDIRAQTNSASDKSLSIKHGNTTDLTVLNNGHVGIGEPKPTAQLHIKNEVDGKLLNLSGIASAENPNYAYLGVHQSNFNVKTIQDIPLNATIIQSPRSESINFTTGSGNYISISESDMVVNKLVKFGNNSMTINESGLYEISASFVVNLGNTSSVVFTRIGINFIIYKGTTYTTPNQIVAGTRYSFVYENSKINTTVDIPPVLVYLNAGDQLGAFTNSGFVDQSYPNMKFIADPSSGFPYSKIIRIVKLDL